MYRRYAHPLLRPLLAPALSRITSAGNAVPRPTDAPHAHASGADPDRILLFGSGPALGYGVLSHDLGLPGHLARQISAATGRGTDVDLLADSSVVVEDSMERLSGCDLGLYDSVVLSIGTNNALLLTSPAVWRREMQRVLDFLTESLSRDAGIYIVAIPPMSSIHVPTGWLRPLVDRQANRLNSESRKLAFDYRHVTYIPFSPLVVADFTRYRSATTYQQWASVIAAPLITDLLRAHRGTSTRLWLPDETVRQNAVEALGIVNSSPEERFTRIARLASQLLGADQALIMFADHDRFWIKACSDPSTLTAHTVPRRSAFADHALREPAPFVVEDASQDPRFADLDVVRGEVALRFVASYPVESGGGVRVGAISVLSREVRRWTEGETSLLRDLSLMVQRELSAE